MSGPKLTGKGEVNVNSSPRKRFTPREQQVFEMIVGEAMDSPEIAKRIGLSMSRVQGLKYNIYNKTGFSTALELAVAYYRGGLPDTLRTHSQG